MNIFGVLGMVTKLNYEVWEVIYRQGYAFRIKAKDTFTNKTFKLSVDIPSNAVSIRYGENISVCHYCQIAQLLSTLPRSNAPVSLETYTLQQLCLYLSNTSMNFHLKKSASTQKGVTYNFDGTIAIGVSFDDYKTTPKQLCRLRYEQGYHDIPYHMLVPQILSIVNARLSLK